MFLETYVPVHRTGLWVLEEIDKDAKGIGKLDLAKENFTREGWY